MPETNEIPKILICAPQHDSKNYCFDKWADRVNNLTFPEYDVLLVDNSSSTDNTQLIESKGFKASYVKPNPKGVRHTMKDAHNACRDYFLEGGYDFMFHLETDVIPPRDVIEQLLSRNKGIISGSYDIHHGSKRQAMIQIDEPFHRLIHNFRTVEMLEAQEALFFDGKVKQVWHAGIGCILIHRSILENINFKYEDGLDYHPDTLFAFDCHDWNYPIFVDTGIYCEHLNKSWLEKKGL